MLSHADRLHVVDRPGEDPPFVMMHGFPDDHHIYDRLAPLLSPRRVIAFDFFGYGQSDRAARTEEQTTPGEDLTEVLDSLPLDQVVLVSHDASGPVAIDYGLEHPARVPQLVLLDTYFGHAPALRLPEMIRLFADRAAVVLIVVAVVYLTVSHPKHALLFFGLAVLALVGAWFSTGESRLRP
jgi:haloalkane dehalogenase